MTKLAAGLARNTAARAISSGRAIRAGLPEDVEPFAELRDTRKLNDPEKRRVEQARRTRDRTMDQEL